MMTMMNSAGFGPSGFVLLWAIHILSVVLFFVGVLLLVLWAIKTLTPSQLKTWGIGLVVAGTIVCLFTIAARGGPWIDGGFGYRSGVMMQGGTFQRMMGKNMMRDADDMERMMDFMSGSLEGKTGDEFDAAFIEEMIPHHQGAIDMAQMALKSAKHEEIKQMARDIVSAQQREIDQMEQWLKAWGYTE